MRLIVTAALAATLLFPPTALALPGDPPVEAVAPAVGAVLPVSEDGIEVRYACPEPYRIAGESPFTTFGGRKDYGEAKRWSTSGRHDGRWTGTSDGNLPTKFRVSGNGRTVRDGRFQITLLCPTPGMLNPFTIQLADAPLTKARIAPDGSFIFAGVVEGAESYVRGRIRGRTATGRASLSLGVCTGGAEFKAELG